jgi:NitT/TauT family transport system permease protein
MQVKNNAWLYRWTSYLSPWLVILLWEVAVRSGILDQRFFPPPTKVAIVLVELIQSGELFDHLSISLVRILIGFTLGALPAIVVGMAMGWFRFIRAFLDPIVAALYPIPKIALLPLFLVIFGLGEGGKIAIVATSVFFVVLVTTFQGVLRLDPILIQAGQNMGAHGWKLFAKVIFPATLPIIFTGLRLGFGVSLLVIVAAEFVSARAGIGYLIWISWSTLSLGEMYAGIVVIAILGLLSTAGLEQLGRRVMPWAESAQ